MEASKITCTICEIQFGSLAEAIDHCQTEHPLEP